MANNPYVNKVEYGDQTLIDLTEDDVAPDKLMRGTTAHDASGAVITGMMGGLEVSDTEPTNPSVDVWFQEQQQGTPVEVYTVAEINDMIAPAETSPTQAAYHVGEYIICVINGQAKMHKVIAEISPGETLNPGQGGNIEEVSIGSLMTVKKETYTYTSNNYATLRIDEFSGRNILLLNWLITSGGNGRLVFFGINSPAYPGYLFKLLDYANTGGLTPMPNTTVTIKFTFIEF